MNDISRNYLLHAVHNAVKLAVVQHPRQRVNIASIAVRRLTFSAFYNAHSCSPSILAPHQGQYGTNRLISWLPSQQEQVQTYSARILETDFIVSTQWLCFTGTECSFITRHHPFSRRNLGSNLACHRSNSHPHFAPC